ncbi:MAG TPA: PilN domain-containing protein [Pyrinomonadaceae bacterium]|jgi:Tfp pilus assembly protein PilN|nr:PilN domain-containing protein [Pyrinomonadaceae bacterium]
MIKINLLNSVTERQHSAFAAVDRGVGSSSSRLLLIVLAVGFLTAAVIGWDIISSSMAKTDAETQLAEQKRIAAELEVVMAEQRELESKIQQIDGRIDAIKNLRASQAGPSAVLEAMRERLAMVPGLYLQSIEQKGDQIEIKGNSPSESVVTQFGRSLEFSNGLFSNLNIETERKEVQNQMVTASATNPDADKVNIVNFTIKTAYTPSKAGGANNAAPTSASTMPAPGAATPQVQIAKN